MNHIAKPLNNDDYKIPHLNPYRKIVSRMGFSSLFILFPYMALGSIFGFVLLVYTFGSFYWGFLACLVPLATVLGGVLMGRIVGFVFRISTNTPERLLRSGKRNIWLISVVMTAFVFFVHLPLVIMVFQNLLLSNYSRSTLDYYVLMHPLFACLLTYFVIKRTGDSYIETIRNHYHDSRGVFKKK